MQGAKRMARDNRGMALVLVLMAVAIITALAVEFSYEVYISTSSLYNWQASQRLSLASKSAARLAAKVISEEVSRRDYTYPGFMEMTYENPIEKAGGMVLMRAEDENSKFHLNKLVFENDLVDGARYESFKRLLRALGLDEAIADRIVDWIDRNSEPRRGDSEEGAKNALLDSVDEVYLMGIDEESVEKLVPYVTIHGDGKINVNGAEAPVLMSLSPDIDRAMAERIVNYRENNHFERPSDFQSAVGETVFTKISSVSYTFKGTAFRIISTATSGEIKRTVECVIDSPSMVLRYWKER